MLDYQYRPLPDLRGLSDHDWLLLLEDYGEEEGYFEPLGQNHSVAFLDRGSTLLVTFETLRGAKARAEAGTPFGMEIAQEHGWSALSVIAHNYTWFRDGEVYAYFDRLVDDDFFGDFDQVVFYGEGMCGYAAAAYSVTAPGSTVIALSPQASLSPSVAEWDRRFLRLRKRCFTDRYGFAPDMIDAAKNAYILYDPDEEFDAIHASLFTANNVTRIRCRDFGSRLEKPLENDGILRKALVAAGRGQLSPLDMFRLMRTRRDSDNYLRRLLERLLDDGRLDLAVMLCQNVMHRLPQADYFEEKLEMLQAMQKRR